jgi:hypothetical protein
MYGTSPASLNVCENVPLVGMMGELIGPPCTAWESASLFTQVTVSPTETVTSAGWNAKSFISTVVVAASDELALIVQRLTAMSSTTADASHRRSTGDISS